MMSVCHLECFKFEILIYSALFAVDQYSSKKDYMKKRERDRKE